MPIARSNGIDIFYDTAGDPAHPTILLVSGLGAQMTSFDEGLMDLFVARGYHVVRYDNRDTGKSTWFDDAPYDMNAGFASMRAGTKVAAPYSLSDMAADGIGVLDHLNIQRAHIVGTSMGGMLVQTMAIEHPRRVASLTSIMSSPGEPDNGQPVKGVFNNLMSGPVTTREEAVALAVQTSRVVGSKQHFDEERAAHKAGLSYDRAYHPDATQRQLLAIWSSGPRTEALRQLRVPTLVIHGRQDPLIQLDGGIR
ncbi:MAG: alpha/beta hydrolase, partial [Pseudonocardiales bacterium]|nr:alpha/beta hydrolase [Pseudonocardiales bacterium]